MAFTIQLPDPPIKNDAEFEQDLVRLGSAGRTLASAKLSNSNFTKNLRLDSSHRKTARLINREINKVADAFKNAAEMPTLLSIALARDVFAPLQRAFGELFVELSGEQFDDELTNMNNIILDCKISLDIVTDQLPFLDAALKMEVDDPPVLPENRPAPIQAVIIDDILSHTATQSRIGSIDYPSANRTREALRRILTDVLDDLRSSSNVDRGYIRICERLLGSLAIPIENVSIEDLGIQCQLVERSTRRLAEELGAIVLDQIKHVLAGVGVLLNQFDEWRKFLDEQARTNLDPEDGEGLVVRTVELIADLEKPGAPVEPELVRRLRGMVEPALEGIVGADTVAVPLVCSLSNIFSALSQHAIEHYQAVIADHGHAVAAGAAALLARFAADLIEKFCPILSRYQPLSFIISVVRYLLPMYSQAKDATS